MKKLNRFNFTNINYPNISLDNLISCRLDHILFKLNWATSLIDARFMIQNGVVLVNNAIKHGYAYTLKMGDTIAINSKFNYFIKKKKLFSLKLKRLRNDFKLNVMRQFMYTYAVKQKHFWVFKLFRMHRKRMLYSNTVRRIKLSHINWKLVYKNFKHFKRRYLPKIYKKIITTKLIKIENKNETSSLKLSNRTIFKISKMQKKGANFSSKLLRKIRNIFLKK